MAKYRINDDEIVCAENAEDALNNAMAFYTIEDLIDKSSLFDVFEEIEDITDIIPDVMRNDCYANIEKISGFSIEESADESHAQMNVYFKNEGILCVSADYLTDDDDNDDDDDDDNASFYRDYFDSDKDADEWYEGLIL